MAKKEKINQESPHKREAYGLLIAFIGLFFILSLVSYHPADGGLWIGQITGEMEIQNWFGQLGAFFAGPVFMFTFGYFSISFFLYILVGGVYFLLHRPFPTPRKWYAYLFIWSFWGSVVVAFLYRTQDINDFYPSGMFGQFYVNSAYALLGEFGAVFSTLILILASAIITFRLTIILNLKTRRKASLERKLAAAKESPDEKRPGGKDIGIQLHQSPETIHSPDTVAEEEVKPPGKVDAGILKELAKKSQGKKDDMSLLKDELSLIGENGKIDHAADVDDKEWESFVREVTIATSAPKTQTAEHKKQAKVETSEEKATDNTGNKISIKVNWDKIGAKNRKSDGNPSTEEIAAEKARLEVEEAIQAKEVNIDKVKKRTTRAYKFPSMKLLSEPEKEQEVTQEELEMNAQILEAKLADFNIEAKVVKAYAGPVVTMFELKLAPGIKISKVTNLTQDLAMGMQARGIRIIAPIPGKSAVGIEIPNRQPQMVRLRSLINSKQFANSKAPLTLALGKTVNGDVYVADLAKMPHLLIAGTTGSGKSVGINTIITSLLYRANPDEVKFVMIDPKMLELSPYKALEQHHLSFSPDLDEKVVTKPENAVAILNSVVQEMENRYKLLSKSNVRKLDDYNEKLKKVGAENMPHPELNHKALPFIIVIIDELADLMITASKEIEQPIARLAQMARAVGIHLVVATQRPSVDVLTGVIKANFPTRLAYQVSQKNDSRTILDMNGAEQLLGNGDMLFLPSGESKPIRLQNGFISTEEVESIIAHIANQPPAEPLWLMVDTTQNEKGHGGGFNGGEKDALFEEAKRIVVMHQQGSVSLLQRRMKVGYARAARIMDQLEEAGVVGPFEGSKARDVLLTEDEI